MKDAALTSALEKAGGPSALARHFGITPSAVIQWDRVPSGRVLDVERHTGVSRHALRPDIYGPASTSLGEVKVHATREGEAGAGAVPGVSASRETPADRTTGAAA